MKVTMNALAGDSEALVAAELAAAERVIRSGWWILGDEVARFEREWSALVAGDHPAHAVGVANGMDAIQIGLMALGIGAGDEVITTSMTAFATVLAIVRAGATPVLADIDPATATLDPASVRRCLSASTRAVIVVHLYGQIGAVEELAELCAARGVVLIEDCAQAHGAMVGSRSAGTFGAVAAWSFYPTKNLGAVGDAGALTTASDELAAKARVLRNYGQSVRYVHTELGLNSRLDELQAALLLERLPYVGEWTAARRLVAQRYSDAIRNAEIDLLPLPGDAARHVHHLFVVRCARRHELREHLAAAGVESLSHYPIPVHQQPPTADVRRDPEGMAATEMHAAQCLSIPCHPYLSPEQVDHVLEGMNSFAV